MMPADGPTLYDSWATAYPLLRWAVPVGELAIAAWWLSGIAVRQVAMVTMVMMSLFIGLLASEIGKEHPRPCGCMGAVVALYEPSAIRLGLTLGIGRNILMLLAAAYLYRRGGQTGRQTMDGLPDRLDMAAAS